MGEFRWNAQPCTSLKPIGFIYGSILAHIKAAARRKRIFLECCPDLQTLRGGGDECGSGACCDIWESTTIGWWCVEPWLSVKRVLFCTAKASDMGGHAADSHQRSNTHTHTQELPPCFLKQSQADSQPDAMVAPHWGSEHRHTSGSKNITSAAPIPTDPVDKWNPATSTSCCTAESLQGRASQVCVSKHQPAWDHMGRTEGEVRPQTAVNVLL